MSGNYRPQSVTPPKRENNDGDRTFLESHALTLLPVSTFWDTHPYTNTKQNPRAQHKKRAQTMESQEHEHVVWTLLSSAVRVMHR